jgi:hypothetical protein
LTNKTITDGIANTQSSSDNSTKIATTAFVKSAITLNTNIDYGTSTPSTKTTTGTISTTDIFDSGIVVVSDAGGSTQTLPTAAQLAAAMPGGTASAGDVITFTIVPAIASVSSSDIITITPGTGGTFVFNGASKIYPLIVDAPLSVTSDRGTVSAVSISLTRVNAPPRLVTIRFTSSSAYIVY